MDIFQMYLEKRIFFPGELVSGNVQFMIQDEVSCKGIKIELVGIGRGEGIDSKSRPLTHQYAYGKLVALSKVIESSSFTGSGGNFYLGRPWQMNQGKFNLAIPTENNCQPPTLKIRVLNRSESVPFLGEVIVDVNTCLNKGIQEVSIMNGPFHDAQMKFAISWCKKGGDMFDVDYNFSSCKTPVFIVCIHVMEISRLMVSDFDEIFLQLFWLEHPVPSACEATTSTASANNINELLNPCTSNPVTIHSQNNSSGAVLLRNISDQKPKLIQPWEGEPDVEAVLPAGIYTIRFQLELPVDLPSTLVAENCSIVYFIRASLKPTPASSVAIRVLPTKVEFFTVQQATFVASHSLSAVSFNSGYSIYPHLHVCCMDIGKIPYSNQIDEFTLSLSLNRPAFAPSETITATLRVNCCNDAIVAHIDSVCYFLDRVALNHCTGQESRFQITDSVTAFHDETEPQVSKMELIVPCVPATYLGGLAITRRLHPQSPSSSASNCSVETLSNEHLIYQQVLDPVTWHYELTARAVCIVNGIIYKCTMVVPVIVATVSLMVLPTVVYETESESARTGNACQTIFVQPTTTTEPGNCSNQVTVVSGDSHAVQLSTFGQWQKIKGIHAALAQMECLCIPLRHRSNVNVVYIEMVSLESCTHMPWYYSLKMTNVTAFTMSSIRPNSDMQQDINEDDTPVNLDILNFRH